MPMLVIDDVSAPLYDRIQRLALAWERADEFHVAAPNRAPRQEELTLDQRLFQGGEGQIIFSQAFGMEMILLATDGKNSGRAPKSGAAAAAPRRTISGSY